MFTARITTQKKHLKEGKLTKLIIKVAFGGGCFVDNPKKDGNSYMKRPKLTFSKTNKSKRQKELLWLPVAIGASGFLLIIIIFAIKT